MNPTEMAQRVFDLRHSDHLIAKPLQDRLATWQNRTFGAVTVEQQALGVAEEAGELAHAVLKMTQRIRGMQDADAFREAAGDAIADCTIFLMQLATTLRLDFATLVSATAEQVMTRTYEKLEKEKL